VSEFKITLKATGSVWPPACDGVADVITALESALRSAAEGNEKNFNEDCRSIQYALDSWYFQLWWAWRRKDSDFI